MAAQSVRRDPWRWVRLAWPKLYFTYANETFPADYLHEARPDLLPPRLHQRLRDAMTWSWWPFWVVALFALAPWRRRAPLSVAAALPLAIIVTTTLTHLVVFGGDRYHLPLVGLFVPLCAAAFRGRRSAP